MKEVGYMSRKIDVELIADDSGAQLEFKFEQPIVLDFKSADSSSTKEFFLKLIHLALLSDEAFCFELINPKEDDLYSAVASLYLKHLNKELNGIFEKRPQELIDFLKDSEK